MTTSNMSLLALSLAATLLILTKQVEPTSPECSTNEECYARFVKIQQEMNDILKLARKDVESMQRVKPDKLDKPNPLLELYHQMVYQKKYFDSKRNENRNFQTQGW